MNVRACHDWTLVGVQQAHLEDAALLKSEPLQFAWPTPQASCEALVAPPATGCLPEARLLLGRVPTACPLARLLLPLARPPTAHPPAMLRLVALLPTVRLQIARLLPGQLLTARLPAMRLLPSARPPAACLPIPSQLLARLPTAHLPAAPLRLAHLWHL